MIFSVVFVAALRDIYEKSFVLFPRIIIKGWPRKRDTNFFTMTDVYFLRRLVQKYWYVFFIVKILLEKFILAKIGTDKYGTVKYVISK